MEGQISEWIKSRVSTYDENRKVGDISIIQTLKTIDCNEIIPGTGRAIGIRCPECILMGVQSKVHISSGFVTSAGIESFYDESGIKHSHDRNVLRSDWSCTNGHVGRYRSVVGCPFTTCTHRGYTLLTTDPYKFKEAVQERKLAEEKRNADLKRQREESAKESAKESTIKNPDVVSEPIPDYSISSCVNTIIIPQTVIASNIQPGTYYSSSPSTTLITPPTPIMLGAFNSVGITAQNNTQPNTIQMEIKYGNRTYVGTLTATDI